MERPTETVGQTGRQDTGVDRTRDRGAGRDRREHRKAQHVFDVVRAERPAVFVDQDGADGVGDRGMPNRAAEPEIATAHDHDADARDFGERARRGIVETAEVADTRARDRRRARPRARRRLRDRRAGPCTSPAGSSCRRGATSTARCSSASAGAPAPARIQSSNPGAGSCARPSTAGWSPERSMMRASVSRASTSAARGRDHGSAGAAFRRPEAHEHGTLPTSGRTASKHTARNNRRGRRGGRRRRTLGARRLEVKGSDETRTQNVGFALVEAAFFDLDKTVIATSSVMALGGTFYRDGLISKRTIVRGLYAQVVYLLVGADDNKMERMREAMLALTKGWDQQYVKELVRETLDVVLTPIIYAEALELIEEHRKAGRKTVIVSSSPAETVEPIGEYLGVDDVIATRARLDERGPLHRRARVLRVRARTRPTRSARWRWPKALDLASSYAYSDSITDLPMLELVGNPVAVNPDRELARIAREREWEVRYFQRPVRLRDRVPVPPKGPTLAAGGVAIAAGTAVGVYVWLRKRDAPDRTS